MLKQNKKIFGINCQTDRTEQILTCLIFNTNSVDLVWFGLKKNQIEVAGLVEILSLNDLFVVNGSLFIF